MFTFVLPIRSFWGRLWDFWAGAFEHNVGTSQLKHEKRGFIDIYLFIYLPPSELAIANQTGRSFVGV